MAEYGIVVTGNDSGGDYVISDSSNTLVPYVLANAGKGTSCPVPPNAQDYLLYINATGLTNPNITQNSGIGLVNVSVNTTTDVATFYSASSQVIVNAKKGTFTVRTNWTTQSAYFIVLTKTDALNIPAAEDYGIQIKDANANEVFDSRKVFTNDSFRILGEYTFDDPFDSLNVSQTQTITTDEDMFVEMNPFIFFRTTDGPPQAGPETGACGPRFENTEILHELDTGSFGLGAFFGSYTFGKLLYNNTSPSDVLNALPAGFTGPY
jgi:hypothetical protein